MGVFDDIPLWARTTAQPLAHTAAQATEQAATAPPKKRGRPKGAKDSKPRARLARTPPRPPKEPDDGNAA
jgi:hypothetical protein